MDVAFKTGGQTQLSRKTNTKQHSDSGGQGRMRTSDRPGRGKGREPTVPGRVSGEADEPQAVQEL